MGDLFTILKHISLLWWVGLVTRRVKFITEHHQECYVLFLLIWDPSYVTPICLWCMCLVYTYQTCGHIALVWYTLIFTRLRKYHYMISRTVLHLNFNIIIINIIITICTIFLVAMNIFASNENRLLWHLFCNRQVLNWILSWWNVKLHQLEFQREP